MLRTQVWERRLLLRHRHLHRRRLTCSSEAQARPPPGCLPPAAASRPARSPVGLSQETGAQSVKM